MVSKARERKRDEKSPKAKVDGNKGANKSTQETGRSVDASGDLKAEQNSNSDPIPDADTKTNRTKSKNKKTRKEASPVSVWSSLCGKVKYFFLLIFVPPFLNYASLQREATELKPQGEMYDIGWGQKLFMSCVGNGPPTVLLDAPTGMNSDVWTLISEALSKHARVCVYDRAGIGFSERPFNRSFQSEDSDAPVQENPSRWAPFTVERMVDDLHRLLTSSSQQPQPFIVVGAELGALVAQFYSHLYENSVAGLVLVNPLPDELLKQGDGIWSHYWFGSLSPVFQTLQLGAALGITRLGLLVGALKQPITGQLVSEEIVNRQKYLLCHPRHLSSVVDEHYFINETMSQLSMLIKGLQLFSSRCEEWPVAILDYDVFITLTLRKLKSLPASISVSILTGNYYDEQISSQLNKAWASAEQQLLSKVYPGAQHLVVNGADRHMLYRKPEPIVEVVLKMVRRWKRSQPTQGSKAA